MKVIFNSIFKSIKKASKWYIWSVSKNNYIFSNTGSYQSTIYRIKK